LKIDRVYYGPGYEFPEQEALGQDELIAPPTWAERLKRVFNIAG